MTKYPLASPSWDDAEYKAMQKVIDSGAFTMGEYVRNFETAFSHYVNSKFTIMVNSGSSANLLMVAALFYRQEKPVSAGDEVIVPAVSWGTTYYPLHQYGLHLKFVDIDPQTLNFNLEQLKSAISDKTRLIMAVNLLGNPNDYDAINKMISGKNIILLEDNCESLGATYNNRHTGTFGLMGSYSSFFSHHISTMEGGMITTDDEELYHILLSLRSHGWTRHLPENNLVTGKKSLNSFDESFKFVLPGYNVRPLELSGAIGIEQLKKLPEFILERRKNAQHFIQLMNNHPCFNIQKEIGNSSWFGFSIVVSKESGISRDAVLNKLEEYNIEYRPIVSGNFTSNKVMKWFDFSIHGDLTHAKDIHTHGFFIGNHHYPLEQQFELLDKALSNF